MSNRKSGPTRRKFRPASNHERVQGYLGSLPPADLVRLAYQVGNYRHWWIGEPSEERILELRTRIPQLETLIDFDVVLQRVSQLESLERGRFGLALDAFLPELLDIHTSSVDLVHQLPPGIDKAELYLRPIAEDCGADSDVEAAVYFASRGKMPIDAAELRSRWHAAVCADIPLRGAGNKSPKGVLARAQAGTISLAEAAEILLTRLGGDRFFSFRDEEEDFIDAAFFRATEWLNITGFEPWLKSLIEPFAVGPKYGIGESAGWWLFFVCRSDLALRLAGRQGPEAWLWGLVNGEIDRTAPWRVFWGAEAGRVRDYLPLAGIILFTWRRINPQGIKEDILIRANELLFQTQMTSGAWPLFSDSAEACLLTTCFAIHGLALSKPLGWHTSALKAADWILSQQGKTGLWYISGAPTVMLTVLALDALELAHSGTRVTFRLTDADKHRDGVSVVNSSSAALGHPEPVYDFSQEHWFSPPVPSLKPISYQHARGNVSPRVGIVVATETELRQVLRFVRPLAKQRKIWKSTLAHDTFYVGKFGAFEAVVILSGMGSQGVSGSTLSIDSLIHRWDPAVVLMIGIAFGSYRQKQLPGDVLVAEHLIPYEQQRVGEQVRFRNPIPPSSEKLLNRFRNTLDWEFTRPDGSKCMRHIGPLLSGEKLADSIQFKESLLAQYPNAIGGEMEGTGLWSAAQRAGKDWLIVKGVCDWADGRKHDEYQPMAAAAAASLCVHVFADAYILDGI